MNKTKHLNSLTNTHMHNRSLHLKSAFGKPPSQPKLTRCTGLQVQKSKASDCSSHHHPHPKSQSQTPHGNENSPPKILPIIFSGPLCRSQIKDQWHQQRCCAIYPHPRSHSIPFIPTLKHLNPSTLDFARSCSEIPKIWKVLNQPTSTNTSESGATGRLPCPSRHQTNTSLLRNAPFKSTCPLQGPKPGRKGHLHLTSEPPLSTIYAFHSSLTWLIRLCDMTGHRMMWHLSPDLAKICFGFHARISEISRTLLKPGRKRCLWVLPAHVWRACGLPYLYGAFARSLVPISCGVRCLAGVEGCVWYWREWDRPGRSGTRRTCEGLRVWWVGRGWRLVSDDDLLLLGSGVVLKWKRELGHLCNVLVGKCSWTFFGM